MTCLAIMRLANTYSGVIGLDLELFCIRSTWGWNEFVRMANRLDMRADTCV